MRSTLLVTAALAALLAVPVPTTAQAGPTAATRARHSIVLGGGSGSTVAYWSRVGARTDLGLEGTISFDHDDDADFRTLAVGPVLQRYLTADSRFAPYFVIGATAAWSRRKTTGLAAFSDRSLGGFVGVGLDWYIVDRVSLGGYVGLSAVATRSEQPDLLGGTQTVDGYQVRTRSSGFRLRLFF